MTEQSDKGSFPSQQAPTQQELEKALAANRSYYTPAIITLVLYVLLFWLGGLIANLIYLNSAINTKKLAGKPPEGLGCLWALLIVNGGGLLLAGLCFVASTGFLWMAG